MSKPIEVLYAPTLWGFALEATSTTPVVRYSDHSAKVLALLQQIESLTALAEKLQAELTVAKYSQQAVNTMVSEINKAIPRWDGKPKAM